MIYRVRAMDYTGHLLATPVLACVLPDSNVRVEHSVSQVAFPSSLPAGTAARRFLLMTSLLLGGLLVQALGKWPTDGGCPQVMTPVHAPAEDPWTMEGGRTLGDESTCPLAQGVCQQFEIFYCRSERLTHFP